MTGQPSRRALWLSAFGLTTLIVLVGKAAEDFVSGRRLFDHQYLTLSDVLTTIGLQIAFAGIPLFALAWRGDRRRVLWLAGFVLTLASWAYAVLQIRTDAQSNFAGGANIGLGLIMLAAPFAILLVLKGLGWMIPTKAD